MIKYQIHNIRKGRASTTQVGGKRISLASDEEKVISFTDYKKYEKSLEALKISRVITIEKLIGEKAKSVEISKDDVTIAPVVETVPEGSSSDDNSDANVSTDESKDTQTSPQQNQGKDKNRNRNRNRR